MTSSEPDELAKRLLRALTAHEQERSSPDLPSASASGPSLPSLPRYEIRERLGEGATSVVYRAWDRELARLVAVKVLREFAGLSPVARERFRREARAAGVISHPNVVTVYDVGEHEGALFLVMELVEGRPFGELLRGPGDPGEREVRLLEKAARGVAAAHERGIIHRDLKPANILVTPSGEPKVSDFGLAHLVGSTTELTRTGTTLGTPLYMSPEQVLGQTRDVSPRSDVHSLGAILYEILTGRPPFNGESVGEIFSRIIREDPVPPRRLNPRVPRPLETIALKALAKTPARRYPSAGAFADDLRSFLAGEPIAARPEGRLSRFWRWTRRHPAALGVALAACALLAAAGVVVPLRSEKERTALELVEEARGKTRVALDGALRIRRAGSLKGTRDFLPEVQKAFEAAVKRVPDEPELYFLMGRVHRALMEDAEALRFQEQALARDPAYAPALYERIVLVSTRYGDRLEGAWAALRRRGLSMPDGPAEWIAALEQAEKADPELRADRERILRDCEQLKGVLDRDRPKAETEAMGDASVLAARGILAFHRCRYEEAKLLLQDALAKDGSREEAWGALAVATSRAPEPDPKGKEEIRRAVERIYSEALRRDRGYVPHLLGRAHIRLGIVEDRIERGLDPTRDLEGAERDLEAAMELTPRNPWARLALANLRTSRGSYLAGRGLSPLADFAAADGDLAEALRLAPEDREVWKRRGSLRLNAAMARAERGEDPAADFEAAETALNESVKRDPSASDTLNVRGFMRMQRGLWRLKHGGDPGEDFRAAERDLVQAVTLRENYAVAWRNLGQLRFHKGALSATRGGSLLEDFESAEDCFGRALQFEPDQAKTLLYRGRLRFRRALFRSGRGEDPTGDFRTAEEDLGRVLALNPTHAEARAERGAARFQRALWRHERGDKAGARQTYAAAADDLKEAVRLDPRLEASVGESRRLAEKRAADPATP